MGALEIHFIPPATGKDTKKQKELARATQRAHSAKLVHVKRKARNSVDKSQHQAPELRIQQLISEALGRIPTPPVWKGSSDPFSALSIEVTPSINWVLKLYQNTYLPALYIPTWLRDSSDGSLPSEALVKNGSLAGSKTCERAIELGFRYPECVPSWFFLMLTTMREVLLGVDAAQFQMLMLQYRTRSLQILRKTIAEKQQGGKPTVPMILQILWLFGAECMINESMAAEAHAVVVPWIDQIQLDPEVSIASMVTAMFNDTEMACKLFQKTALDYEVWFAGRLEGFWAYTETFVPSQPAHIITDLHPTLMSFTGTIVYGAAIRIRRCLHLRDTLGPLGIHPTDTGDLRFSWLATKTLHDIGLLINQAIDLITEGDIRRKTGQYPAIECSVLDNTDLRVAVTLTTLFSLRKFLHESSFNGIDVREAPPLIPAVKQALTHFLSQHAKIIVRDPNIDELLFWMYFIGCWQGQKLLCNTKIDCTCDQSAAASYPTPPKEADKCARHDPTFRWFNAQLSIQARLLGLMHWSEARQLLTHFIYSDIMRPHPSTWYEQVIREAEAVAI